MSHIFSSMWVTGASLAFYGNEHCHLGKGLSLTLLSLSAWEVVSLKCTPHLTSWEQLERFELSTVIFRYFVFSVSVHRKTRTLLHQKSHWAVNPPLLQVCIEKMQDLQLALVISRLYESEFEMASTYKKILQRHVLGHDKQVHTLYTSHLTI